MNGQNRQARDLLHLHVGAIELRVSELVSGVRSDVAIKLYGEDLDELRRRAEQIARSVSGIEGADEHVAHLDAHRARTEGRLYCRVVSGLDMP